MKLIIPILIAALFTSCSATRKFFGEVESNKELIPPTVSLVTTVVFQKAVSPNDRVAKAQVVRKVAEKLAAIEITTKPTEMEFINLVLDALPSDQGHWGALANVLGKYYTKYTLNIKDTDVATALSVIKGIAEGLNLAASVQLKE